MSSAGAIAIPIIQVDGNPLDSTLSVVSVHVTREVNRIPDARIVLAAQGSLEARQSFLSGRPFAPGAKVVIGIRVAGKEATVFKGLVSGMAIRSDGDGLFLTVEMKSPAVRLTGVRRSAVWRNQNDGTVIRQILQKGGQTLAGAVPATEPVHAALVQFQATDWDFVLTRAEAHGLVVVVGDDDIALKPMAVSGGPTRKFALGTGTLGAVEFELNALHQQSAIDGTGWDAATGAPRKTAQAGVLALPQGRLDRAPVGEALGRTALTLSHMVPMPEAEIKSWTRARMARSRLSLIRGRVTVPGIADLKPMEIAALSGFGDRFDGNALITGFRHQLTGNGFRTDIQFGLAREPAGKLPDLADMAAGGLLPPVSGLHLATVAALENDPDQQVRARLVIPALGADQQNPLWARVAMPDAGNQRGFFFHPEAGDEVVVGFLDNDPRHPVILGRLHGARNVPPKALADGSADNLRKGIVTRSGTTILFTDGDKPALTLKTGAGNQLVFDDGAKSLTITDQNGNSIAMSDGGIKITAKTKFEIEAGGDVIIKGTSIKMN
jgi:Rhs element Vgr protein